MASLPETALRLRRARRDDVPAIVRLLADDDLGRSREEPADPLPDGYWRAFEAIDRDPRNLLAVAELGDALVGTLQLTFVPSLSYVGGERMLVESVRIDSRLRGRGLGRAMLAWALDQARDRGCRMAELMTNRERHRARRFYESLGFQATHEGMKLLL